MVRVYVKSYVKPSTVWAGVSLWKEKRYRHWHYDFSSLKKAKVFISSQRKIYGSEIQFSLHPFTKKRRR